MTTETLVTLNRGGTKERTERAGALQIPDLWHIAMTLDEPDRAAVLEVWHLAADLKTHIIEEG
jgi:hypothetical protein